MVDVGCRSGGGRCVLVVAVVASVVGRGGRHYGRRGCRDGGLGSN